MSRNSIKADPFAAAAGAAASGHSKKSQEQYILPIILSGSLGVSDICKLL